MTRADIDYWHALEKLFVFDDTTKTFIPADEFPTRGGWVTDYHKMFYRLENGEYIEDPTAFEDLRELEQIIDVEYGWSIRNSEDFYDG